MRFNSGQVRHVAGMSRCRCWAPGRSRAGVERRRRVVDGKLEQWQELEPVAGKMWVWPPSPLSLGRGRACLDRIEGCGAVQVGVGSRSFPQGPKAEVGRVGKLAATRSDSE